MEHTVTVPNSPLRAVLGVNAATSFLAGVAGLAGARRLVDELGLGSEGWTRLVSLGLVIFAIEVAIVAARATRRLRDATLAISIADLSWVAATVVVLATVDLTTTGRVVAIVMGVGVAEFALLQLWFRRQALSTT